MNVNSVARIASLIGEPARTAMLMQLLDNRAMTATELARSARISPATASRHLALLVEAKLLELTASGRHRYHRIASGQVAEILEGLLRVAGASGSSVMRVQTGPKDEAMRRVRLCYSHLAGRLGVAIALRLQQDGAVRLQDDAGWVTNLAPASFARLGLAFGLPQVAADQGHQSLCRPCMDWSERQSHLAGRLGTAICHHCIDRGWLTRGRDARAMDISPPGRLALRDWLGLSLWRTVEP